MKEWIVVWVVILFVCCCVSANNFGSMVYTMFYVNSTQFQEDFEEYCIEQEILRLREWIAETSNPEYRAYLEGELEIWERYKRP